MRCEILSTGDEVLTGQIVDTNAAWLAEQMGQIGFEIIRHATVGDDRVTLRDAFHDAGERADVVVCTGGLGPTVDDLTTEVASEVLGVGQRLDEEALDYMQSLWRSRGREMPDNNRKQAMLPEGSETLRNPIGTAPGFAVKIGRATFFFMPGVPREMKKMFADEVVPRLQKLRPEAEVFDVRVLRSFGLAESAADQMLAGLEARFPEVKLGFRAHFPEIMVKLTGKGSDVAAVRARLDEATADVYAKLGAHVFSQGVPLEEVVGQLLREKKATVATAESCTGGLVAQLITNVPGSSDYFHRGFVTYANEAKEELLGVPHELLEQHGAVSEECARAMAEGVRAKARADYGVSITGIAGPSGGTPEKPVGLVYLGLATPTETHVRRVRWPARSREQVRLISAYSALDLLRRALLGLAIETHELGRRP